MVRRRQRLSSSCTAPAERSRGDLEPRDVVADLDRQVELGVGLALAVLEGEARFAERQALEIERAR